MTLAAGLLPTQRRYRPTGPLDLDATLRPHRRGPHDPCQRVAPDGAHWRTWRTPLGPATLRLATDSGAGEIDAQSWGPGADWALDGVPALLGAGDDWTGLAVPRGILHDTRRRLAGMRLSRTGLVFEALVPAILEQLVTSTEAFRSWRQLVTRFGEVAPGPAPEGMRVIPDSSVMRQIPDWEWHRAGLDGRRRHAVIAAAGVARQLDASSALDIEAAVRRLISLQGVGEWTAAEVVQRSHGAADVVSVGDYHLPNAVGFVFTGRARTDDAGMVALLEPFRPHRQRVVRLVEACGVRAPRFGPRMVPRDYRHL